MKYTILYELSGVITVEAANKDEAWRQVEQMDRAALFAKLENVRLIFVVDHEKAAAMKINPDMIAAASTPLPGRND